MWQIELYRLCPRKPNKLKKKLKSHPNPNEFSSANTSKSEKTIYT